MATTQLSTNSNQQTGITDFLSKPSIRDNVMQAVGKENVTRFISSIISAVQATPALKECTNNSILSAALQGEALNLAPSPQLGQFYMVPYENSKMVKDPQTGRDVKIKVNEAQFQIGYKGYIQLAIKSGQYRKIVVSDVRQGEVGFYNPITEEIGLDPVLDLKKRQELPVVGYYGMFELINGFKKEIYYPKEQIDEHARTYSKGYASDLRKHTSYTFWSKNFDAMAKKTLIRQLISKWGIMSTEMQTAYEKDMAVIDENGNPVYVDNPQTTMSTQEKVHEDLKSANTKKFPEADETVENPQVIDSNAEEVPDFMK